MNHTQGADAADRVTIREKRVVSAGWGVLTQYEIDFRHKDGHVQPLSREVYVSGDGAAVLLYDRGRGTVLLVRQFRLPAFLTGSSGEVIEACAGLLDGQDPEAAIRKEIEEETGYAVGPVEKLWTVFMSPGSVTERLHFFLAPYDRSMRRSQGGGARNEGEDIEILEYGLDEALAMVARGEICDAKTIMLLQHAALNGLCRPDGGD